MILDEYIFEYACHRQPLQENRIRQAPVQR